jgi:hypothetical protein
MKIVAPGILALSCLMVFPRLTVTACAFIVNPFLGVLVGLLMLMTLE